MARAARAFLVLLLLVCPLAARAAERHMVAAAHPLAAEAGLAVLRQGGGAVDAAIAAQMVLTLVEPQSSGIGGGAFLMHWDAAAKRVTSWDGRETAPAAARPERFLDAGGKPLPFPQAVADARSVGVPGVVAMLAEAHRRHGRLPWSTLFEPAVALAEAGFPVSPRLHAALAADQDLRRVEPARSFYYRGDGQPVPPGALLRNPELAATLRLLAAEGPRAFYEGPIAWDIVAAAGGGMTPRDLAAYRAVERPALCRPYRGHTVCGMGPPSSGGVAVLQILGLLERGDFAHAAPLSSRALHLVAEASRLAFADRARYLADPDFVPVPVNGLLAPDYLDRRAALIGPASMGRAEAGEPAFAWPWAPSFGEDRPGTSHLSIVDGWGDAIALTTTIEGPFGAKLMVRGFLLNNELTDFDFMPVEAGRPVANRVEPGKRPRSSMAPTLVFDSEGRLRLVTGSPGGGNIIGYVAKAVIAALDWRMDPQAAAALPNFGSRNGPTEIEAGTALEGLAPELRALGHDVRLRPLDSGIQTIAIGPGGLTGGADPRREGVALGD